MKYAQLKIGLAAALLLLACAEEEKLVDKESILEVAENLCVHDYECEGEPEWKKDLQEGCPDFTYREFRAKEKNIKHECAQALLNLWDCWTIASCGAENRICASVTEQKDALCQGMLQKGGRL